MLLITVALRKESVDRNFFVVGPSTLGCGVALRKESVDRNNPVVPAKDGYIASLSARRAWIEIPPSAILNSSHTGRSPQGERG